MLESALMFGSKWYRSQLGFSFSSSLFYLFKKQEKWVSRGYLVHLQFRGRDKLLMVGFWDNLTCLVWIQIEKRGWIDIGFLESSQSIRGAPLSKINSDFFDFVLPKLFEDWLLSYSDFYFDQNLVILMWILKCSCVRDSTFWCSFEFENVRMMYFFPFCTKINFHLLWHLFFDISHLLRHCFILVHAWHWAKKIKY